ncbi:hypothetical protein Drorol1_Dr00012923, partial [Drosera rotundifolia]
MELISGRKALDETMPDEKSHLVTWFRRVLISKDNFQKAIDDVLNPDEETYDSITRVAELAGYCTAREPHQRPDMGYARKVFRSGPTTLPLRFHDGLESILIIRICAGLYSSFPIPSAPITWSLDLPSASLGSGVGLLIAQICRRPSHLELLV